ncbi:Protein SMG5 [Nymphon striatum]|nr:Protein SMG5 [Nymphon striatum]
MKQANITGKLHHHTKPRYLVFNMENAAKTTNRPNLRSAEDKIRRLDSILKNTRTGHDLFSPEVTALRNSLKDELEQLILFSSHETVIFKSQDYLWRKVYYEVINYFKMLRTNNSELKLDPHLKTHVLSGIGTYQLLLKKYQSISISSIDVEAESKKKTTNSSIFKFNIALGDLSRYHADMNNAYYRAIAESYYRDAMVCMPNDGSPFNQLGTLYCGYNYSLDSIYYHIRGLLTIKPFQGTEQNLKRFFLKNSSMYEEIQSNKVQDTEVNQVKKFLVGFVQLVDTFYSSQTHNGLNLPQLCQEILNDIPGCLPTHQGLTKSIKLEYIPRRLFPDTSFKIMVILQMCFELMRSCDNAEVTTAVAFLFAFMSHVVCYVISACRTLIPQRTNSAPISEDSSPPTPAEPENQNEVSEASNPEVVKKPKKRRFKGRRRCFSSSNSSDDGDSICLSDLSDEFDINLDDDDYEALSETEADCEKLIDSLDATAASLNASEELAFQVAQFALNEKVSVDKEDNNNDEESTSVSKEEDFTFKKNILHLLGDQGYLCAIKIFCDWLKCAPNFLESCASSSKNLWPRLALLVNYLQENAIPHLTPEIREEFLPLLNAENIGSEWLQPVPLHEDTMVKDFPGFEDLHSKLFAKMHFPELNDFEQIAVRLKCLNQFCHFFSNSIKTVVLQFNSDTNLFSTIINIDDASFHDDRWIKKVSVI